jgi:hypothetical protein
VPEWLLQKLPTDGGNSSSGGSGGRGKNSGSNPATAATSSSTSTALSLQGLQKVMTKTPAPSALPSASAAGGSPHKASYHAGLFHAVTAACTEAYGDGGDGEGLGHALAAVLTVYNRCSARLVEAQVLAQAHAAPAPAPAPGAPRALPPPPPPSTTTLADRRKHVTRVLLVALHIVAAADNAYQRRVRDVLDAPLDAASRAGLTRAACAAARTRRHVFVALSDAMDDAGGASMLATHDSMQVTTLPANAPPTAYTTLSHTVHTRNPA